MMTNTKSDEQRTTVLSLNVGSSSTKAAVFCINDNEVIELSRMSIERTVDTSTNSMIDQIANDIETETIDAIGHRVVHGGLRHEPALLGAPLLAELHKLFPFAPLHLPPAVEMIEAAQVRYPNVAHIACFDTAFHRSMPVIAQRFALPKSLWEAGIRRFGFHGLSYEYVVHQIGVAQLGRAVIAHLGNGVSLCAVRDGQSVDTTMGFTPTGGVVMGTRSGDFDPGLLVYLMQEWGFDAEHLGNLINNESGLLGLSGTTSDMRKLLTQRDADADAAFAIDAFCYSIRKQIGAYSTVLGGLDTLVFTGGIGEHAEPIRQQILDGLDFLGDIQILVVPTDEEWMIAHHTAKFAHLAH